MSKPKLLLTGANGLIGQRLVRHLLDSKRFAVVATGRQQEARFPDEGVEYRYLDLAHTSDVKATFDAVRPALVIHAGGMSEVDACESDPELCEAMNVEATRAIARGAEDHGSRLIYISTDFVFDGENGPYREDAKPNPINEYGRSKLAAEQIVDEAGVPHTIVRTVLVYGTGHDLARSNFAMRVVETLRNGGEMRVARDAWRTPTWVDDLARAVIKITERGPIGLFHVAGKENVTIEEFARRIARAFNLDESLLRPVSLDDLEHKAPRPRRAGLLIGRAPEELDYEPHSIDDALRLFRREVEAQKAEASHG